MTQDAPGQPRPGVVKGQILNLRCHLAHVIGKIGQGAAVELRVVVQPAQQLRQRRCRKLGIVKGRRDKARRLAVKQADSFKPIRRP